MARAHNPRVIEELRERIAHLEGSAMGAAVRSLLVEQDGGYTALLPLRAPDKGKAAHIIQAQEIRQVLNSVQQGRALLIDLKTQSDALYNQYLQEAIVLSLMGIAAIVLVLFIALKNFFWAETKLLLSINKLKINGMRL